LAPRRYRIAFLTHNLAGVGGSYQRALGLAAGLARRGHRVSLLASRRRPGSGLSLREVEGVTIVEQPDLAPRRLRHGGLSPFDLAARVSYLLRTAPEIVHGMDHRPAVSVPGWIWKRRARGRYVSDWADLWGPDGIARMRRWPVGAVLGRADGFGERWVRQWADATTVISRDLGQRCAAFGLPPERIVLLPPGAYGWRRPAAGRPDLRRRFGLPEDAPIVASAGFAEYDDDLLGATFVDLMRRTSRVQVVTLGGSHRGPAARLAAAGAGDRHHNLGFLSTADFEAALAAADVFLLPYSDRPINRGRFPNKVGEYLAAGRPIVANPTGEVGRLLREHRVGLLAEEEPAAMAGAALRLLEDRPLARDLGEEARRLAEGEFSWEARAVVLEALYRSLIG
jgi:glycosyltransferase involved in cell wall biosynthesis